MLHHRVWRREESDLDQLTRDCLVYPEVRKALNSKVESKVEAALGPEWRALRTTVRGAAKYLKVDKGVVYNEIRKDGKITLGAVWDERCRLVAMGVRTQPTLADLDTITAWSRQNTWPLSSQRKRAFSFMRSASAARIAGLDLSNAHLTSRTLVKWGLSNATILRWAKAESSEYTGFWSGRTWRVRIGRRGVGAKKGAGPNVYVWRVSDLLDWFLATSLPEPAILTNDINQDPARNCYRSIMLNLRRFLRDQDGWKGAENLQRAWNWYWKMLEIPVGRREGEAKVTAYRLDNYIAQALEALSVVDPDWTRPALDVSTVRPERYYAVWVPPNDARMDVAHIPMTARLIQVMDTAKPEGYRTGEEARAEAKRRGTFTGRVGAVKGEKIISRPHAYTR